MKSTSRKQNQIKRQRNNYFYQSMQRAEIKKIMKEQREQNTKKEEKENENSNN